MSNPENILMVAAVNYSRSENVSLAKVSWALSSLLQKPDGSVYYRLKEIDDNLEVEMKAVDTIKRTTENMVIGKDNHVIENEDDALESRLGEVVNAEVLSVKTFGAICRVENTTRTLLLHISEMANEFIEDVRDKVKEGDTIKALLIINRKGELGLSTKRINWGLGEQDYRELYVQE